MTRETSCGYTTSVSLARPRTPSRSRTTMTPARSWRYATFVVLVSIFGNASIAGATTWTVVLTNATHPAQSQSNSINAPTGGSATSPKSTSLSLSWVAPSSGATPSGYLVTRTNAMFVVTGITSTNASGKTVGVMSVGDTFAVTFNYAVMPSTINTGAGASTMTLVGGSSTTTITISNLSSAGGFPVTSNYESSGNTSAAAGTLSLSNANKTVTFTVTGTPTNSSHLVAGSASTFTFTPLATIQDTSGDTASTSFSQSPALQIF
jgi:hypothetical protein